MNLKVIKQSGAFVGDHPWKMIKLYSKSTRSRENKALTIL